MTNRENIVFNKAIHPGVILKSELSERDIKQKDFAEAIGMKTSHLSELIKGKRDIGKTTAERLENALGIPSNLWLKLQAKYDYDVKVIEERIGEESQYKNIFEQYNERFDINLIMKYFKLSDYKYSQKVEFFQKQLRVDNFEYGLFKKSMKTGLDSRMIATWTLIAQYVVSKKTNQGVFSMDNINELCLRLRTILHRNKDTIKNVESTLSQYGIKFAIVPKIERASIDGYSFIDNNTPCIVLTQRYNRIDNFAFALLHEIGHIKLHLNEINSYEISISENCEQRKEIEANEFASNVLISRSDWNTTPTVMLNPYIIQNAYTKWAHNKGYNKWIVLGRISHETGMYKFKSDKTRDIQ